MRATLIDSKELSRDVRHFVFEASDVDRLDFAPGQFASLTQTINGKEITRAYSFASAPGAGNRFELCLNLVPDGLFSAQLFEMKPGDVIAMRPPLGTFTLKKPARDSVFVATGTGIAPFRSMLQAHLSDTSPAFTLVFGSRYEAGLVYKEEFEAMAKRYPHFRFWPVLTRPDENWTGRRGRVQAHVHEAIGDRRDLDIYLCGLQDMVNEIRAMLKEMGFDRKQILHEKYD